MTLGVLNTHKYIIFINHKYLSIIMKDIYDGNICFDAKNRIFGDLPLLRWLNRSSGWFFETYSAYSALFLDSLNREIFS